MNATNVGESVPRPRTRQLVSYRDRPDSDYVRALGESSRNLNGLASALGWFSVGLGVAQLLAPRAMNRLAGFNGEHVALMRLCGFRELASGIGILSSSNAAPWVRARVAGDAMDLAALGLGLLSPRTQRGRAALALTAVAGFTALDIFASRELDRERIHGRRGLGYGVPVESRLIVNRPPQDCYQFWRKLENLPQFMRHLESVSVIDDRRSHWVAKAPAGTTVEWDAEITEERPNALLSWRSLAGSQIPNLGTVRFEKAPSNRGTLIVVSMQYDPPAGRSGAIVAKLLGEEPSQQVREDLRRFKQLLETGEIPTTRGQPAGRRSAIAKMFGKGETP